MSLRLRLTLLHTLLLALMLTGFAVLLYAVVSRQLTSELDNAIRQQALGASRALRTVSPGLAEPTGPPPPRGEPREGEPNGPRGDGERGGRRAGGPPPLDLTAGPRLPGDALYLQVVDETGAVLSKSPNLSEPLPVPAESLRRALAGEEVHDTVPFGEGRVELYSAPLMRGGEVVGVLQVGVSLAPLETRLVQLRIALALLVLVAVGVAATLAWLMAGKALRPVDRMTQTAFAIGHSTDLSQRIQVSNERDELGRLAATFNEMLAQLDRAFANQRRFLADAAHELRTPLTTVRINAEALLRGAAADPTERDETLRAILRESERMGRLVNDLLVLARADEGQALERKPLALDELLLDVYRQAQALTDGVQLKLGELEQVEVEGDRDRLQQLALNLVDNALRYTPAGGHVTLDVVRLDGSALLRVSDTGPGIAAEHLPRIFERFYRVDRGRSRTQGGTGLGLSISQWIARAHGGRVDVASTEGRGSTFTLVLPARVGVPAVVAAPPKVGAKAP